MTPQLCCLLPRHSCLTLDKHPALPCSLCRVGRTGRAGAKGTAITFIGPDEEQYAPDLVKALKESGAAVPQDLQVGAAGGFGWQEAQGWHGLVALPVPPHPLLALARGAFTHPPAACRRPPASVQTLADGFEQKRKEGKAQLHSSGFGGSGFKFDASEDNAVRAYKKVGRWGRICCNLELRLVAGLAECR